jgi:hypothetical protein
MVAAATAPGAEAEAEEDWGRNIHGRGHVDRSGGRIPVTAVAAVIGGGTRRIDRTSPEHGHDGRCGKKLARSTNEGVFHDDD